VIDRNEIVIAGTISGASVTYSTEINHNTAYTVQGKWAGSGIVGLAKLQMSLNGTDWVDDPASQVNFDGAGGAMWSVEEANYNYLRIWMESTSGSVTFQATLVLKRQSKIG
jgi:hypothetical protein